MTFLWKNVGFAGANTAHGSSHEQFNMFNGAWQAIFQNLLKYDFNISVGTS